MRKTTSRQNQQHLVMNSQMMHMQQQLQKQVAPTEASHPTVEHPVDIYIVTVGFEVNKPNAFSCQKSSIIDQAMGVGEYCIQDLSIDYGHAFFYVTKNNIVKAFFSFGPKGGNKYSKAHASRPGNSDYFITEPTKLFRLLITKKSYDSILQETIKVRTKITNREQKYTAWLNDTCAEEARDILKKGISNIPNGTGGVKNFGINLVNAVNPYMWHRNFKKADYKEYSLEYWPREYAYTSRDTKVYGWTLYAEDIDPLIAKGKIK